MVCAASRLQTGALCIGAQECPREGGWTYSAEQGFAGDALQPPLVPRSGFQARLKPGVRLLSFSKFTLPAFLKQRILLCYNMDRRKPYDHPTA